MANKQINELSQLTTASGTDHMVVYDTNEAGSEKTKRISVEDVVGGWILVHEYNLNNETMDQTFSWDSPKMRAEWWGESGSNGNLLMTFNGETAYRRGLIYQDGTLAAGTSSATSSIYLGQTTAGGLEGYMVQEFTTAAAPGGIRGFGSSGMWSRYMPGNSDNMAGILTWRWDFGGDAITSVRIWNTVNMTANTKIYKWNDISIN